MAIDTRQKRMSAISPACTWRGCLVDATETGFTRGNRQSALYLYAGTIAVGPRRSQVSFAVLEVPIHERRVLISYAQLLVPEHFLLEPIPPLPSQYEWDEAKWQWLINQLTIIKNKLNS